MLRFDIEIVKKLREFQCWAEKNFPTKSLRTKLNLHQNLNTFLFGFFLDELFIVDTKFILLFCFVLVYDELQH